MGNFTNISALRLPFVLSLCLSALLIALAWGQQRQPAATPQEQQLGLETLDISAMVLASDRNGAAMHQRLLEFTYIQKRISREVGPRGKVSERVREFEAYPIKSQGRHRHILSLIRKDGVSVPQEQLEKNLQLAVSEMETAEREALIPTDAPETANAGKYVTAGIGIGPAGEGVWLGVSQFLRQCRFEAPHHARLANREMIALTIRSCAGNPASPREDYLRQLSGIVWIDAADKVVVRLEAWPISSAAGAERPQDVLTGRPTAEILVYEQQRVSDGIWAPRRIRLNGLGKAALFNGVDKDMIFEFSDYRRFSTEIKETELMEPKKKPIPF